MVHATCNLGYAESLRQLAESEALSVFAATPNICNTVDKKLACLSLHVNFTCSLQALP